MATTSHGFLPKHIPYWMTEIPHWSGQRAGDAKGDERQIDGSGERERHTHRERGGGRERLEIGG